MQPLGLVKRVKLVTPFEYSEGGVGWSRERSRSRRILVCPDTYNGQQKYERKIEDKRSSHPDCGRDILSEAGSYQVKCTANTVYKTTNIL